MYLGGRNVRVTGTTLDLLYSESTTKSGGAFYYANSGTGEFTVNEVTVNSTVASINGGFLYFGGTTMTFTVSEFHINQCLAKTGKGGCLSLSNSGNTNIDITKGNF